MPMILSTAAAKTAAAKPCVQCANYVAESMCAALGEVIVDVVTGSSEPTFKPCEAMRRSGQQCGPDAALFEVKAVAVEVLRPSIEG